MVRIGRKLVYCADFNHILTMCDDWFANGNVSKLRSLKDLVRVGKPYLDLVGFGITDYCLKNPNPFGAHDLDEPRTFFWGLFHALPSQEDLDRNGPMLSAQAGDRVRKLYGITRETVDDGWKAAVTLLTLAASLTQVGVYENGKLAEPVARFHYYNGARIHPFAGPILNSRPADLAALGMGQVIVYDHDCRPPEGLSRGDVTLGVKLSEACQVDIRRILSRTTDVLQNNVVPAMR